MGGDSSPSGTSYPVLFNWQELLPPWTQAGQQIALPYLMSEAITGGMTPTVEKSLWGSILSDIDNAASQARRNVASRWIGGGGAALNSPAYNAAMSSVDIDRISQMRKAAADFAKIKQGARDTATKNMLTALYTPPPSSTAQVSQQSGGGGGK